MFGHAEACPYRYPSKVNHPTLTREQNETPIMTQDVETPETIDPLQEPEPPISSDDFAPEGEGLESLPAELSELNLAIEIYPDAAANYAARGDYFRQKREYVLAVDDYRRALALAEAELAQGDWALVAQAIQDRVLMTLAEMGVA
jgi:hypothetical protein